MIYTTLSLVLSALVPTIHAACGGYPSLSNGYAYSNTGYDDGDMTYYTCDSGYAGSGDNNIRCNSYYWETLSYSCIVDCGSPSGVSNGGRSVPSTTVGSTASYYCNTGYYGSGSSTITCQSDHSWTNLGFSCTIYDCGTPGGLSNGDRNYPSTTYGSTATYHCNTGYWATGTSTITCQSNGHWSGLSYSCTIYDCGTPPSIVDGTNSYSSTTYNSGVTYSCNTGYDGSGSNSITCQSDGTWSSLGYSCTIKDCGTPSPITHATVTTGVTTYLAQHTYTCLEGYVESGTDTITCQADGTWSPTDYDCPPYDCGQPMDIKDSTIDVPLTTFPNNATYLCDLGHYESDPGNMSIMCTHIGWQNFTFWCIPYDCEPPTFELPRSVASWDTTIFRTLNSSTVKYTCNIGYIIDPEEFEDGEVECNHTGQWDEVEFNCIFNYCKNVSKAYKTPSTYPSQTDGLSGQMYLLNDTLYTVECCGTISGWEFKPVKTGFIYLMLWRRNENFIPVMVAYNTILVANTSSIVNVTVTDDEKIAVQPFDQIGWYSWEENPIAFEDCDPLLESNCPQANLHYPGIQNMPEGYDFDWDNLGNILNNRSYAIKVYFTRNTPLQFLEEEYNVSIPDHMIGNEPFMTFSIVGVDHAERATYTLEPLGNTPQTIYFFIDSYFATIKVLQPLPKSNETNEFVYNVTAVDGCENYGYTILTVNTYNAPPKFENIPNQIEVKDDETHGNMKLYDIIVSDPTNDSVCCTLQQTFPNTLNFELVVNGDKASVMTSKNAYFSASFVDSYFVKFCCQDVNYSTSAILQVKVKGEFQEEVVPLPGWFVTSLLISCVPIFALILSSCILLCYLLFGL